MKRLFRIIDRSGSFSEELQRATAFRIGLPNSVVSDLLYSREENSTNYGRSRPLVPELGAENPAGTSDNHSVHSIALSESETLAFAKPRLFELQNAYQDNYTSYLPFLMHQHRIQQRQQELENYVLVNSSATANGIPDGANLDTIQPHMDIDDDRTIASAETDP